ncbi:MAG: hypothetical protein P8N02_18450, partial [Actinomycetota bacterium]|nr:hypothetical protein [Actinomycetota bacterium]
MTDAATDLPTVWFDRPLLAEMRDLIEGRANVLFAEPGGDPLEGIEQADGVVAGAAISYDRNVYARAPKLRIVCRAGIGFDNL